MASILSRLLTADKPWSVPYQQVQVSSPPYPPPHQQQYNVVSGNDFPNSPSSACRRKRNTRKQDGSVRFGRVPKREKAKILAAMQKVNASSQEKALCAELEDELRLLSTIVRAHEETCDYTRDKVAGLVERAQPVYTQCPPQLACPLNPAPHILENGVSHYMEDFSERFAPAIKGVVEFAKRIPGFGFLSQDDQVTLLKAGVFEVLLVRLACMFDAHANSLICLNGQVLRRESLHTASNARFLLDSMFDFAERLNALRLSDAEVGLFCAVVVIAADRPGLRNTELVLKIQKKMMDILQKSVAANHPENPAIFGDLMKKIPDLRTLNTLHSEKLLAYKMEPRNRAGGGAMNAVASDAAMYSAIPHDIWSQYALVAPPCLAPEEDLRSASPGQHSQHGGSTTGSEWSTTDSKDELVGSPRSIGSGLCPEDVKSPVRTSSFSSSRSYVHEDGWPQVEAPQTVVEYHALASSGKRAGAEINGSEHGSSSGDEGYFVDSPIKGPVYPKLRRVDSPTDSGIESGKEHGSNTTPTASVCSSPLSSVDEKVKDVMMDHEHHQLHQEKQEHIEDMPVLKRALQAPPLVNTNMLMDEAYRHHKKFRAARREAESPSSPGGISLASTHSTLVRTLEQAPRYLSEQQLKRTDLIHNIIMRNETLPGQQQPEPMQSSCPNVPFSSYGSSIPNQLPPSYTSPGNPQQQKQSMVVCPNGYYIQHGQTPVYSTASWAFGGQPAVTVTSAPASSAPIHVNTHFAEPLMHHQQQSSPITTTLHQNGTSYCSSPIGRSGSPRLSYAQQRCTPPSSAPSLVMNGGLSLSSAAPSPNGLSSICQMDTRPSPSPKVILEGSGKPHRESSQPLNLCKRPCSPPMLNMDKRPCSPPMLMMDKRPCSPPMLMMDKRPCSPPPMLKMDKRPFSPRMLKMES